MKTHGRHFLLEFTGCNPVILASEPLVRALMLEAARAAGASVVGDLFHAFDPPGLTGILMLAESHLSIHTWPTRGYAAVDLYTCGDCVPEAAIPLLAAGLEARQTEVMEITRGQGEASECMRVSRHALVQADADLSRVKDSGRG